MKTKTIILISLVLFTGACNMNSPEMIEKQIANRQKQVKKMNARITELEAQLMNDSTDEVKFRIPVSVKQMRPETFRHFIEVTGKLEAEEDAFISPEMNGQIENIYVKEGQAVKKGQLLASLNTSVIESSITEVKTGLELASKLYEKQKELWDQGIGSELQFLEAKNAKEQAEARLATLEAQLDMARVTAPFSGVVEKIMMKEGELAIPGMQLMQLISLENLKLYGDISERYLTSVKKGDDVDVSFPDIEGLGVTAPIYRVGNLIDNASRTFRIEIKVNNRNKKLKPNMYSLIRINDFSSSSAFIVPSVSIKQDIKGNYLYVADTKTNKARKRYVKTGLSYEDQTMLLEGVSEGENIIVKGFAQVSDGIDIALK
jgi:RND family efflux transporter MFP subunit